VAHKASYKPRIHFLSDIDPKMGLEWEVPSPAPFHTFETPPKLDVTATKVIG
jgi:hypothetical protein